MDKKTYERAYQQLAESYTCQHTSVDIRERTIRGGSKQYVKQCLRCGEAVSNAIKKEEALSLCRGNIIPFDEQLKTGYSKQRKGAFEKLRGFHSEQWWAWYNDYLASNEWAIRRDLVLLRCGRLCEGCMRDKATEVHHLTYDHVGNELLFELVGLCKECHQKAHEKETE